MTDWASAFAEHLKSQGIEPPPPAPEPDPSAFQPSPSVDALTQQTQSFGFQPTTPAFGGARGHFQPVPQGFRGGGTHLGGARGGAPCGFRGGSGMGGAPPSRGTFTNITKRFHGPPSQSPSPAPTDFPSQSTSPDLEHIENPMSAEEIALLNKFIHKKVDMMRQGTVDVIHQQKDPSSPLHSLTNFRDLRLKDELLRALDMMGFQQPSKIQEFALPLLLMEPPTNMIAQSQSGTGKTAAFVIAMLSRVNTEDKFPQCLCLAPTFELAHQIGQVVDQVGQFLPDLKVHYAVKGTMLPRGTQLQEQVIIGTPGKTLDYLTKLQAFDPSKLRCIVLDEADVMISQQGHKDLSIRIYNEVLAASPGLQALLFSATYDDEVITFAEQLIKEAVMVTLRKEEQTLPNIKQYFVECSNKDAKYEAVVNLYSGLTIASAIIFCHTVQSAMWLAGQMRHKGHEVTLLHGQMPVEERALAIQQFKDGVHKVLITTNVCARGIDVSQVSVVINYDPPLRFDAAGRMTEPDYETYLHRIGRTGRFGKAGIAINFVDSKESLQIVHSFAEYFQAPIVRLDPTNIEELERIEAED